MKQSLRISVDLHYNGQTSFYSSLTKMSEYYNLPNFNYYTLNENNIKQYIDLMKKKHISYWHQTALTLTKTQLLLQNQKKLWLLRLPRSHKENRY